MLIWSATEDQEITLVTTITQRYSLSKFFYFLVFMILLFSVIQTIFFLQFLFSLYLASNIVLYFDERKQETMASISVMMTKVMKLLTHVTRFNRHPCKPKSSGRYDTAHWNMDLITKITNELIDRYKLPWPSSLIYFINMSSWMAQSGRRENGAIQTWAVMAPTE